jgi:hypothetical protein
MLRATITTKLYRIPAASRGDADDLLPGHRDRLNGVLHTHGTPDDPDVFDLRERVRPEFAGEPPESAADRAARIEESIVAHYDGIERVDESESGDTTKTEDTEE